jgi:hypothetical protein
MMTTRGNNLRLTALAGPRSVKKNKDGYLSHLIDN